MCLKTCVCLLAILIVSVQGSPVPVGPLAAESSTEESPSHVIKINVPRSLEGVLGRAVKRAFEDVVLIATKSLKEFEGVNITDESALREKFESLSCEDDFCSACVFLPGYDTCEDVCDRKCFNSTEEGGGSDHDRRRRSGLVDISVDVLGLGGVLGKVLETIVGLIGGLLGGGGGLLGGLLGGGGGGSGAASGGNGGLLGGLLGGGGGGGAAGGGSGGLLGGLLGGGGAGGSGGGLLGSVPIAGSLVGGLPLVGGLLG